MYGTYLNYVSNITETTILTSNFKSKYLAISYYNRTI